MLANTQIQTMNLVAMQDHRAAKRLIVDLHTYWHTYLLYNSLLP